MIKKSQENTWNVARVVSDDGPTDWEPVMNPKIYDDRVEAGGSVVWCWALVWIAFENIVPLNTNEYNVNDDPLYNL